MAQQKSFIIDQAMIIQYCNVTGSDETSARNMLEAFSGNLEQAINMYLEGETFNCSSSAKSLAFPAKKKRKTSESDTTSSSSSSNLQNSVNISEEDVRAPIPQKQAVLVEDQYHALPYPVQRRQQQSVGTTVFDSCRDFKRETEEYQKQLQNGINKCPKKKRLHELFRPPTDIMHHGDFQSARNFSSSKNKWLLVNIQNNREFSCQVLNRDVWSNKIVRELLEANFVLWQENHDSDDGLHYGTFYKIHNYPHVAIIDPRTGERMVVWEKFGMRPTANQFAELATLFLSEHPSLSFEERSEICNEKRSTVLIDLSEDDQLETALKASLQDDRKQILVSDTDDSDDDPGDDKEENGNEPKPHQTNSNSDFDNNDCSSNQNKVVIRNGNEEEESPPIVDEAKILLRLPDDGRRQIVICLTNTLSGLAKEVEKLGWPKEKYELIKSFPRQNISHLDQQLTLKAAGLHKQETIFVQDR